MRFTTAWSGVLSQNVTLRSVILCLSICMGLVSILAVKMGFQEPLIIEKSCFTKVAQKGSSEHTKDEIEAFLKLALSQRFDSGLEPSSEVVSLEETTFKRQEQQELSAKNMRQKIILNSVDINGSEVKIDADRLISVGQIRSVLSFPILASISTTTRTDGNPYGLQLARVSQIPKKSDNQ